MQSVVRTKSELFIIWLIGVVGYIIFAKLGLALATINSSTSPVWPAAGFAAALVVHFGLSSCFGIGLGAFLANFLNGSSLLISLGIASGTTLECLITGLIIKVFYQFWVTREDSSPGHKFMIEKQIFANILISVIGPAIAGLIGSSTLYIWGSLPLANLAENFVTWWVGDGLGVLIFFPMFTWLFLAEPRKIRISLAELGKILFIVGLSLATAEAVFHIESLYGLSFLIFPVVALGSYLLLQRGIHFSTFIIVAIAIFATTSGFGPFAWGNTNQNLISLQLFLCSLGLTALVLGSMGPRFAMRGSVFGVLMAGWLTTGAVFYGLYQFQEREDANKFASLAAEAEQAIYMKLESYHNLLNGGVGAVQIKPTLTASDWKTYVQSLDLDKKFSGVSGIGFVSKVARSEIEKFQIQQQKNGNPGYTIHELTDPQDPRPSEPSNFAYAITYLEPLGRNRPALGLDLASGIYRRAGAEAALTSGKVAVTKKITLVQDRHKRAGFLMYVPVFISPEKRLLGWVYAPFVYEQMIKGIFPTLSEEIAVSLAEDKDFSPSALLYEDRNRSTGYFNQNLRFEPLEKTLSFAGNTYFIRVQKTPSFQSRHDQSLLWIGILGTCVTLLVGSIYLNLLSSGLKLDEMLKEKTRTLTEKIHLWETLMKTAPVGIFMTDAQGILTYINPAYEKLYGYKLGEKPIPRGQGIHPEDKGPFNLHWQKESPNGQAFDHNFRILASNQDLRHVHSIAAQIETDQQERVGWVGVDLDITELVNTSSNLEKQRLASMNSSRLAALGEMAAGIAHEINNPLTIISGRAGKIRRFLLENPIFNEVNPDLEAIQKTVTRIAKIIQGLKTFSRDSSNDEFSNYSLRSIVDDSLELSAERLKTKGIDLLVNFAGDEEIRCRPAQISQVLVNLINNAFDAIVGTPSPWVKIEVIRKDILLEISVTDSGLGIPEQVRAKVMQPFFTTKDVGKGTGLGLSISRGIIEEHGGHFFVDEGSTHTRFVIHLPIAERRQKAA